MKKIIILIPLLFIISGCDSNKIVCTMTTPSSITEYSLDAKYTIEKDGDYVKNIISVEKYKSDNADELTKLEAQAKSQYKEYNDKYGGYTINTNLYDNKLEVTVVIDYEKIDLNLYAEDFPSVEQYMKNNKLTITGAKELFKMLGATCR